MERYRVTIDPLTALGAGTGTFIPTRGGFLQAVAYTKDDYANGVTLVVSVADSGLTLLTVATGQMNASVLIVPQAACHLATTGEAIHYNDASNKPVVDKIPVVAGEEITLTIASGGNGTGGTFDIAIGDEGS
jgi:hypothetical protein